MASRGHARDEDETFDAADGPAETAMQQADDTPRVVDMDKIQLPNGFHFTFGRLVKNDRDQDVWEPDLDVEYSYREYLWKTKEEGAIIFTWYIIIPMALFITFYNYVQLSWCYTYKESQELENDGCWPKTTYFLMIYQICLAIGHVFLIYIFNHHQKAAVSVLFYRTPYVSSINATFTVNNLWQILWAVSLYFCISWNTFVYIYRTLQGQYAAEIIAGETPWINYFSGTWSICATFTGTIFVFYGMLGFRFLAGSIGLTLSMVMMISALVMSGIDMGTIRDSWVLWFAFSLIFIVLLRLMRDNDLKRRQEFVLSGAGEMVLDRYHVMDLVPIHHSRTAKVFYAKDTKKNNATVVLKYMKNESEYETEISVRYNSGKTKPEEAAAGEVTQLDNEYVIGVTGWHQPPDAEEEREFGTAQKHKFWDRGTSTSTNLRNLKENEPTKSHDFPYIIVMARGERSLHDACSKERIAGYHFDLVRFVAIDTAKCLQYLHEEAKVVHGDIKQRNILRKGSQWILCDMDASIPIGCNIESSCKSSSAYMPPEFAKSREIAKVETGTPPTLEADPKFDVWSFGVVLYELCAGHMLFAQDMSNNEMVLDSDRARLCLWHTIGDDLLSNIFSEAHHELEPQEEPETMVTSESDPNPKAKKKKYRRHTTLNTARNTELPFEDLEEVITQAKDLIRWCLKGDPEERPTAKQLLNHPFLNGSCLKGLQMKYHFFISHIQTEASGDVGTLYFLLQALGVNVWRDMNAKDLTEEGMKQGVKDSDVFVLILTNSVLSRTFCLKEIQWAIEFNKKIVIIVEKEARFHAWDHNRWKEDECTRVAGELNYTKGWLQNTYEDVKENFPQVLVEIEQQNTNGSMLPFRRRAFEVDALVSELLRAGGQHWGKGLPQSTAALAAQLDTSRDIHIIADDSVATKVQDLKTEFQAQSSGAKLVEAVEEATYIVVLLTGGVIDDVKCKAALKKAVDKKKRCVFIQCMDNGWDFGNFYKRPDDAVKAAISGHECLVYRSKHEHAYEFESMVLEVLRRMSSDGTSEDLFE